MVRISVLLSAVAVATTVALGAMTGTANAHATCEGLGGIEVHGQHIVGDYETGEGGIGGGISWPPSGQVGQAVKANGGAAVPGGPGPGFHFTVPGLPPGASFCNEQAHPNGFETPGPHGDKRMCRSAPTGRHGLPRRGPNTLTPQKERRFAQVTNSRGNFGGRRLRHGAGRKLSADRRRVARVRPQGTIGSTIGADGALYVPEGALGHITRVDPETGKTSTFATGLPPAPFGGAIDLTFVGDTAYVRVTLVEVSGIYRMDDADSFTVIANLGAFSAANLPPYPVDVPIGLQFAIEAVDDGFIVSDGHHNRVLHATLDGEVSELISYGNVVPTGLALDGDTIYMSEIGPIPHVPSDGKVVTFDIGQPRTQTVASGVSLVVDVEFGPDGELYTLSQGDSPDEVPPATPAASDSGELPRVKGDGTFEVLVFGLDLSTSLSFSGDSALIVTLNGEVRRVESVPGLAGGAAVVVTPPSAGDAGLAGSPSSDLKTLAVVVGATVILAGLAWRLRASRTSAAA